MKTVVELTREAGGFDATPKFLERFAELVRADEREKYKWDIHSCGSTCQRYACVSMREAVAAEREACAKVCEPQEEHDDPLTACKIAAAIRARSNT
jgi:hypothetical protein